VLHSGTTKETEDGKYALSSTVQTYRHEIWSC